MCLLQPSAACPYPKPHQDCQQTITFHYGTNFVPEIFDIIQHDTFKAQKFQKLYQPSACLIDERAEPTQTVPFERACVTHVELSQDQECLLGT